jgi:hypothetical protein
MFFLHGGPFSDFGEKRNDRCLSRVGPDGQHKRLATLLQMESTVTHKARKRSVQSLVRHPEFGGPGHSCLTQLDPAVAALGFDVVHDPVRRAAQVEPLALPAHFAQLTRQPRHPEIPEIFVVMQRLAKLLDWK